MSDLVLGEHHYYVDVSSYVCKFCSAGFSVYDVTKKTIDYMKKIDCLEKDVKLIKNTLINKHNFELIESQRIYKCKYCYVNMYDISLMRAHLDDIPQCISDDEKLIKDIIE